VNELCEFLNVFLKK